MVREKVFRVVEVVKCGGVFGSVYESLQSVRSYYISYMEVLARLGS